MRSSGLVSSAVGPDLNACSSTFPTPSCERETDAYGCSDRVSGFLVFFRLRLEEMLLYCASRRCHQLREQVTRFISLLRAHLDLDICALSRLHRKTLVGDSSFISDIAPINPIPSTHKTHTHPSRPSYSFPITPSPPLHCHSHPPSPQYQHQHQHSHPPLLPPPPPPRPES